MAGPPNIPTGAALGRIQRAVDDLTRLLDRVADVEAAQLRTSRAIKRSMTDIATEISAVNDQILAYQKIQASGLTKSARDHAAARIADLTRELDRMRRGATNAKADLKRFRQEGIEKLVKSFEQLGKTIFKRSLELFTAGVIKLDHWMRKVVDVHERWTKLMGDFNMQVGALSPNLSGFTKSAVKVEGQIRGLTDNMGEGMRMAAEYAEGFGFMNESLDKTVKLAATIGRGLGVGAKATGEFVRMHKQMQSIDPTAKDLGAAVTDTTAEIIAGARTAGISVNAFSKEIVEGKTFMVQFGKEGKKAFLQSAAWAKSLGLSLKGLESFYEKFDTFQSATESAAKINVIFGTSINSLQMMLETDPGKRLEMIRDQFRKQGRDFESMTAQQQKFLSQQTGIEVDQLSALFKSGKSLKEFQAEQAKAKKNQIQTEKELKKALHATATTMFAFGQAADRVTMAVGKAISPFLELIGLSGKGGKEFKSFGQVMKAATDRIVKFFHDVAANPRWIAFMRRMATDLRSLISSISESLTPDSIGEFMKSIIPTATKFYTTVKSAFEFMADAAKALVPVLKVVVDNLGLIAASGFIAGGGRLAVNTYKFAADKMSMVPAGAKSAVGKFAGSRLGAAGIGAGVGGAIGGLGGSIGGSIGGALGSFLGPIGTMIGSVGGGIVGKFIGDAIMKSPAQKELEVLMNKRAAAESMLASIDEKHALIKEGIALETFARDQRIAAQRNADEGQLKLLRDLESRARKKSIELTDSERTALRGLTDETTLSRGKIRELTTQLQAKMTAEQAAAKNAEALADSFKRLTGFAEMDIQLRREELAQRVKKNKLDSADLRAKELEELIRQKGEQIGKTGGGFAGAEKRKELKKEREDLIKQLDEERSKRDQLARDIEMNETKLAELKIKQAERVFNAEILGQVARSDAFQQFLKLPHTGSAADVMDQFLRTADQSALFGVDREALRSVNRPIAKPNVAKTATRGAATASAAPAGSAPIAAAPNMKVEVHSHIGGKEVAKTIGRYVVTESA